MDKDLIMTYYKPAISVVMPVFNGEKHIKEAIDSVLNQTFSDFEFIIVNDGSIDETEKIINSYQKIDPRIILINKKNSGLSHSLNQGLKIAKGEYIARIDADDLCYPKRFETQLKFLQANTQYILVGSSVEYINELGVTLGFSRPVLNNKAIKRRLNKINPIAHPSVIIRKSVLEKVKWYDENVKQYFEDFYLWHRLKNQGKFRTLNMPLIKYRVCTNSLSSLWNQEYKKAVLSSCIMGDITSDQYDNIVNLRNSLNSTAKRHLGSKKLLIAQVASILQSVRYSISL